MGCNNALLLRYKVRIRDESGGVLGGQNFDPLGLIVLKEVTRVSALTMGSEGGVSLTEYDKIVTVPDGRRRVPSLELQIRMDGSVRGEFVRDMFFGWWEDRSEITKTIIVDICKRDWSPILSWEFIGSAITQISMDGMDLGDLKLGLIDLAFQPYDVIVRRGLQSLLESNIAQ